MNMWGIFFACLFQISFAFSSFTITDKYLNGKQLRIIQVETWFECIKICQEEPLCISYNFDNKSECQINGHGVEERCQVQQELTRRPGWIYHQIREVNKKTERSKIQSSCPCNCGTSRQCRVEPDYGDVPEKALRSCEEILTRRRRPSPDGAYYLQGAKQPIFCHMTSIPGCGNEGGWTLVMKINGSKPTFKYYSDLWKNTMEYQPENGGNLEKKETKLMTFVNLSFNKICLGMKTSNSSSISWLMKTRSTGNALYEIFGVNQRHEGFALNKSVWLRLLPGSTLDGDKKKDGFNVTPLDLNGAHVRIGAIAYLTGSDVPLSYIGFGAGGEVAGMHSGLTCGNVNGEHNIPAFGYILVK